MEKHFLFPYLRALTFTVSVGILYIFWEWGGATAVLNSLHPPAAVEVRHIGKPAPEFVVPPERIWSKQELRLSSLRGIPIVMHFWATWCGPCLQELPELLARTRSLRLQGFTVIAVAIDESWAKLETFFNQHPELKPMREQMVLVLDPDGAIAALFHSNRFPETVLIKHDLVIDNKLVGPQPWNDASIEPYLDRLRAPGSK